MSPVPAGLLSLSPVSAPMPSGSRPGLHPDSSSWASLSLQISRPTLCHLATLLGWSKLRATFAEKDVWTILSALVGRGLCAACSCGGGWGTQLSGFSPRGHSGVWSLPPRLCCSALPARGSPATAHARVGPHPSPGAALVLRCPLTFSFPCARPAASRLGCGARDRAGGVHSSAAVPLDWPATWSHPSHGRWTPFCHCEGRLGPPRAL